MVEVFILLWSALIGLFRSRARLLAGIEAAGLVGDPGVD